MIPGQFLEAGACARSTDAVMQKDHDLDPLRSRPDFQLLMTDLAFPDDPFSAARRRTRHRGGPRASSVTIGAKRDNRSAWFLAISGPQPVPPISGGHATHAQPLDPFSGGSSR